ncbi:DUF6278 family protein [Streptomyces sp. NPDC005955]|uniref:DUF6278 family protein n=1 Tax=Streptomyces sp. NPDC005955 TaxID=3364738 RepID=UPI003695EC1E
MKIHFLDKWRIRRPDRSTAVLASAFESDPEGVGELFGECDLLRSQAGDAGLELDDTVASLSGLDQLLPRWRDDPELLPWLGNDAGLYLGTVVVRTVSGAAWRLRSDGVPLVRLASGREIAVVQAGLEWAANGAPGLSQVYAEAAED